MLPEQSLNEMQIFKINVKLFLDLISLGILIIFLRNSFEVWNLFVYLPRLPRRRASKKAALAYLD